MRVSTMRVAKRMLEAVLMAWFAAVGTHAATVTVNPDVQFQTMDGFGAHGAMDVWWSNGPFHNDQFISRLLDDFGLTILRNEYYPDETPNAMGYGAGQWQKQLPYLRAMKAAADSRGIDLKFMATLWSPPGGMKYNNTTNGTDTKWNRVSNGLGPNNNFAEPTRDLEQGGKGNMYPAFVNYCAEAVERYKRDTGIDLYAFSPANEPRFAQTFNSCVWDVSQYRDMIALLGPEFQKRGLRTRILGAEDVATTGAEYAGKVSISPTAKPYLHIFAVHGYNDGVTPYLPSSVTRNMAKVGDGMKVLVWMTETSGYAETWDGAMLVALAIAGAIKHGRTSGWVWWQISENPMSNYVLMGGGTPGLRYYASKHFYRYIRPGAVLMQSVSQDQEILDIAFRQPAERTFTMVLVNPTSTHKSISLSGGSLPASLRMYRSTANERCVDAGTVSASSVALPPRSVVTLTASNYAPAVGVERARAPAGAVDKIHEVRGTYGLDGRVVERRGAPGVFLVKQSAGVARRAMVGAR